MGELLLCGSADQRDLQKEKTWFGSHRAASDTELWANGLNKVVRRGELQGVGGVWYVRRQPTEGNWA